MARGTKRSRASRTPEGGGHTPVMLTEVLEVLSPRDGGIYVDGTFGDGGYSRALLESATCRVWAIDRDPEAITRGHTLREQYPNRLSLVQGCFGDMEALLPKEIARRIDGIALDLGVSSRQLDTADRGFSFQHDGPLDMRMEGRAAGESRPSASELVMTLSEGQLANILYRYGEERQARRIARAIVAARQDETIERTGQLAAIVRAVVSKGTTGRIDPATRTFQALRIHVNDELGELERGLEAAERLLAPDGRIVVVSFHSLEDRITKAFLRDRSETGGRASRHSPDSLSPCRLAGEGSSATFTLLFRGTRKPGAEEIKINPRARSARLRAAVRTSASIADAEKRP